MHNIVCTVSRLVPGLLTTLNLNLGGTVNQIVSGNPPTSSGSASVLGNSTPLDMGIVSTGVANTLVKNFSGADGSGSGTGGGSGSGGSGSSAGSSSNCPTGSFLAVCLSGNVGEGTGGVLGTGGLLGNGGLLGSGGLNLGNILGGTGSTVTPGILGSLLNNSGTGNLPVGISVNAGTGSSGSSAGSGNDSTLATLNGKGILGNGTNGLVNIGTGSSSSGSSNSSGSTGTGSGGGILGVHINTPVTGGSSSGSGNILNLGL